jgi:hypothetical protein
VRWAYTTTPKAREVSIEHTQPDLLKFSDSDNRIEEPWQDIRDLDIYDVNG